MSTLGKAVVEIRAELGPFQAALARAETQARSFTGRATAAVTPMNRAFADTTAAVDRMTSRFDVASRANPLGGLAARINSASGAVKAAVAGFAAGAIGEFSIRGVTDSIATLAKLNDVAERTGFSTKSLQEFGFAVEQSGGSADDAAAGLQKFAVNTSRAAQGSGDLAKLFTANNVALRATDGALRPVNDLLGDVADLIQGASSEQDKLNIATAAFGRSAGPALVLALEGGRKGVSDFAAQARTAGTILDEGLIKKAAQLDDEMTSLSSSLSGIGKQLAVEFGGPAVVSGMQVLLDNLREIQFTIDALKKGNLQDAIPFYWNNEEGQRKLGSRNLRAGIGTSSLNQTEIDRFYDRTGAGGRGKAVVEVAPRTTVIPTEQDKQAATENERRAKATKDLIDDLKQERAALGLSNTEREISNALHRAGVSAASVEGKEIAALTRDIESYTEALRRQKVQKALVRDLADDRADVFTDRVGSQVRQMQREAGVTAESPFGQWIEETARLTDTLGKLKEGGRDVFKGLADDARAGVKPLDALTNAATKISDKLYEGLTDQVYEGLFSGLGDMTGLKGIMSPDGGKLGTAGNPMIVAFAGGGGFANAFAGAGPSSMVRSFEKLTSSVEC